MEKLESLLSAVIEEAKNVYGEAQYKYYKKNVRCVKRGKYPEHVSPIGDGTEVTETEYNDNIHESTKQRNAAFMGNLRSGYTQYNKKLSVDGWSEHLIKAIQEGSK